MQHIEVFVRDAYMYYAIPKRYIDYIKKPFVFQKFKALDAVNLEVNSSDRIAFLGPNGAGKTTLLKLISGLLYPSKGDVVVNGYNTKKNNILARREIGYVLNEERSFYWRLTGKQNLFFFGALENIRKAQLNERVDGLLKLVELEKYKDKLFSDYSSGMKQKLAIARGMLTDPNILILDEPTRTLDPISTIEIRKIIYKKIIDNQKKILFIATHNMEEAMQLCNKICIVNHGNILYFDTISNCISQFHELINCYQHFIKKGKDETI